MEILLSQVITFLVVAILISAGIGCIFGGASGIKRVLAWEWKWVTRAGRWSLKKILSVVARAASWGERKL